MYKIRFARRTSGRYPAKEFLDELKTRDSGSSDKLIRAFQLFQAKGPEGVSGLYKALHGQGGIVQFTIWKYRVLGFRVGNEVFLTNGFKKDQNETPLNELQRSQNIRQEHLSGETK